MVIILKKQNNTKVSVRVERDPAVVCVAIQQTTAGRADRVPVGTAQGGDNIG